ncbi:MAG: electron transfer flavoprotein subunit alpha/FixB family protein [Desulfotignum sp.]|jgi:electron transfer flavoprotein alpha subunit|nr:electron transfer flavoprotein subunit alpha/FixB family protein [Desulfotignum sp.]
MKKTGILIEMENKRVKDTTLGMITLAARADTDLYALVLDGVDDPACDILARYGITTVVDLGLSFSPEMRLNPAVRAKAVTQAAQKLQLDVIFGLSSADGKDLVPRVAALLDAPLVMDCLDVDLEKNIARTSQYSGKVLADIQLSGDVVIFGIRPNAVQPVPSPAQTQKIKMASDSTDVAGLALVSWDDGENGGQAGLAEADIIIAGGRGLKNSDNFSLIFDCAKKMHAAVGASRVAVDEGWVPYAFQVGQTGEKVSPQVYIACGISGSIQHFAGMKTARMIIAVNKDENAAIMANCDYHVQGDLFEILPELIRQL